MHDIIRDLMRQDIRDVIKAADEYDGNLNDPHGDGSGNDSKAPDGDDYNNLLDILQRLRKYSS